MHHRTNRQHRDTRLDEFVWGPLRLALGLMQMGFAASALLSLVVQGLTRTTWSLAAVATAARIASLILYKGRKGPQ